MVYLVWYMVCWCVVYGTLVYGIWYVVYCIWYVGVWYMVCWCMVSGLSIVHGMLVYGIWYVGVWYIVYSITYI